MVLMVISPKFSLAFKGLIADLEMDCAAHFLGTCDIPLSLCITVFLALSTTLCQIF